MLDLGSKLERKSEREGEGTCITSQGSILEGLHNVQYCRNRFACFELLSMEYPQFSCRNLFVCFELLSMDRLQCLDKDFLGAKYSNFEWFNFTLEEENEKEIKEDEEGENCQEEAEPEEQDSVTY